MGSEERMRPARPRHAASLVLLRGTGVDRQVLMGRRPPKSSFIPDAFVFPGGRLDAADKRAGVAQALSEATLLQLRARGGCTPDLARALSNSAIRETFEETGLMVAAPGDPGPHDAWSAFRAEGLAPDHGALSFLGRAITPTVSPIRFHARFFVADGARATGQLRMNGELLDLDWYPLSDAMALPMIDVTQFVLGLILSRQEAGQDTQPFFRYRRNKPLSTVRKHS
ncbi:MAG TPA: NUDIX hydrolase [Alphaproteobacteria bacterium]|nr:NUDIX hydrolase [Alphaproteobacteria bacterium]HAJ48241.1 NUDIX hydrolase [Alphaproteobacteria bacterium]